MISSAAVEARPGSDRHLVLVACSGTVVVGFAALSPSGDPDAGPDDGQLAELAVDPTHQRVGHASRLLAAVVDLARELGLRALSVWSPEVDTPRITFLTSAGLVLDGARRTLRRHDGGDVVEVRLSALLAPAPPPAAAPAPPERK